MTVSKTGARRAALAAGWAMLAFPAGVRAQDTGESEGTVQPVFPVRVDAWVRATPKFIASANEHHELIGDWVRLDETMIQEDCGASLCFDAIETNGENALNSRLGDGFYGRDCQLGSSRWFLGRNYCNTLFANDLVMPPGCWDVHIGRVQHAWWWQVQGPGTRERCLIEFAFYEDFNECHGFDGFVSAVVVDFGVLDSSQGVGFYYMDLPLCRIVPEALHGPADGNGVYVGAYYRSYGKGYEYATCAQPMLWGLNKPLHFAAQGPRNFDDVHPRDGRLSFPEECLDYDTGVCPGPLAPATSFWRKGKKSGGAQITPKLRVQCLSAHRIVARIKNVESGLTATFDLNGDVMDVRTVNKRGKARATGVVVRRAPYTVRVRELYLSRNQVCQ